MKCIKVLVHQQPYKEILWSFGLEELFSLRWSSSSWFLIWLDLSLSLPLWKSSCLITLEIWLLVLNLVLLSSKSRLTKPWFHKDYWVNLHLFLFEVFLINIDNKRSRISIGIWVNQSLLTVMWIQGSY